MGFKKLLVVVASIVATLTAVFLINGTLLKKPIQLRFYAKKWLRQN